MALPLVIAVNALLDLAVVLAVFAVVRHTHPFHRDDLPRDAATPSLPLAFETATLPREDEALAEAA